MCLCSQLVETFLAVTTWEGCCWYLVGRAQGWLSTLWYRHTSLVCNLLYYTSQILPFFFFLTNWRFIVTFCWASLSAPFSQKHLFISCLCVMFANSPNISNFLLTIIFIKGICSQWSLLVLWQLVWIATNRTHTRQWSWPIDVVCVLNAPLTSYSPTSLPLLGPLYSLRCNNIEIRPVNGPYNGL